MTTPAWLIHRESQLKDVVDTGCVSVHVGEVCMLAKRLWSVSAKDERCVC